MLYFTLILHGLMSFVTTLNYYLYAFSTPGCLCLYLNYIFLSIRIGLKPR
jgi:hypothetical protein